MVAAISMDMVGADVTKNRNSLHVMRTPYSVNSFINEVTQQFFEFVGDTNREKVQNRAIAYNYRYPILDPQGSRDPFYYNIDKHYGASDHAVFLSHGVPAVLFNNWPDIAYHTNEDRSFNGDPTQLKRAAFIGLAINRKTVTVSTVPDAENRDKTVTVSTVPDTRCWDSADCHGIHGFVAPVKWSIKARCGLRACTVRAAP
jgi:Zn-dependent M28 family amino/carboxypeptidase